MRDLVLRRKAIEGPQARSGDLLEIGAPGKLPEKKSMGLAFAEGAAGAHRLGHASVSLRRAGRFAVSE
jgi:hypothetical protein